VNSLAHAQIGIIGGSGLGDLLAKRSGGWAVSIDTPYGPPSSEPVIANWEGVDVAFISRHGPGHRFSPSNVPYRANIWALKKLGVSSIIASGATGSLREDIEPGHLVLCDQVIDKTFRRPSTFFDVEDVVAHVELADPFCARLRGVFAEAGTKVPTTVHHAGTYMCMEGPQFSTRAESQMHRQWGGDLVGMTCMPEARLAREAELCYAMIALSTDYDCWRPVDPGKGHHDLLAEIIGNLNRASQNAIALINEAIKLLRDGFTKCRCHDAMKLAIWSDKKMISSQARTALEPLIGRYMVEKL
jgi:5'-methylthioadenosine phosphorylase